ncbi:MAG: hypothetical protein JW869_00985 [Candidatus Omnitrophica bacterium]|nr:hypothetical protein [Candidatus Omnitrophota bacterium]
MPKHTLSKIVIILAFLVGVVAIIFTQFATPTLYGTDSYLHIRMAELIKNSGPLNEFHWAKFSVFSKYFADKEFLYHVILIPFTLAPDIFFGAKLASCFFGVLFLFIFFFLLRKYVSTSLIPIFILAVLFSANFLCSLSITRPMTLAISLSLLAAYFLIEKRLWAIGIITVIYCLSHVSGPYILFYALATETVRYIAKREFYSKSLIVVSFSILLAYLIHPNFPNNFLAFYLNGVLIPVQGLKGAFELGGEHLPLTTRELLTNYPLIIPGMLLILLLSIFSGAKTRFVTQVLAVYSTIFLLLSFVSHRYIVHSYPFILLFIASYLSDYLRGDSAFGAFAKNRFLTFGSMATLSLLAIALAFKTVADIDLYAAFFEKRNGHYERMGEWMAENIPKGELMFHTGWIDSSFFIGINPKNDYFLALHPIYMYWGEREIYNLYKRLSWGQVRDPYSVLKYVFRVNYGYARKDYSLSRQIKDDERFKILKEDAKGFIFKLIK